MDHFITSHRKFLVQVRMFLDKIFLILFAAAFKVKIVFLEFMTCHIYYLNLASFKRGSSSYNLGWVHPSTFNIKDQLSAGENETDQSVVNVQHRVTENPYFIPVEHKINLIDTCKCCNSLMY